LADENKSGKLGRAEPAKKPQVLQAGMRRC